MRRTLGLTLAVLLLGALVGQAAVHKTYESITVADTAIGFTATTINPTSKPQMTACLGRLETADVRFRVDGTAPTSAEGILLQVGEFLLVESHEDLAALKLIRTGATSGVIKFSCWTR